LTDEFATGSACNFTTTETTTTNTLPDTCRSGLLDRAVEDLWPIVGFAAAACFITFAALVAVCNIFCCRRSPD
jgi:hypothetical protein